MPVAFAPQSLCSYDISSNNLVAGWPHFVSYLFYVSLNSVFDIHDVQRQHDVNFGHPGVTVLSSLLDNRRALISSITDRWQRALYHNADKHSR
jgi:hypothetical protein